MEALEHVSEMASGLADLLSPVFAASLTLSGLKQLDDISNKLGDSTWQCRLWEPLTFKVHPVLLLVAAFVLASLLRLLRPAKKHELVYVLDFSVHKPESR